METLFSALTFEMPSIVTSLVALRPPLMKGDEPGAGMTPGLSVASENGLRPLIGRSTTRLFSIVWLTVELTDSIAAAPDSVTVTTSLVSPTLSVRSTARTCCTSSLISSTVADLKPESLTMTR